MAAPRKEDVKTIIMDATETLLSSHSIDNITLAMIAGEAGISKGTLYYHYKNKESILIDITDRYLSDQRDQLSIWAENEKKDTSFHRLLKYVIERNVYETGPRLHLLYNACIGNEEVRAMIVDRYREFSSYIAKLIAKRVEGMDPNYLSWMLLLLSDGLILQSELKTPGFDVQHFIAQTDQYAQMLQISSNKQQ
ncbi:MAG TPA: TetR/AcrR family transcriptional regulator [Clostridiales bacterium]|nr:TetR/AcrR family transcriptional regulator [Clostridiales bacterium]